MIKVYEVGRRYMMLFLQNNSYFNRFTYRLEIFTLLQSFQPFSDLLPENASRLLVSYIPFPITHEQQYFFL